MRVIPVIDLLDEKVVHAVAGRGNRYRPLKSVLTRSPDPFRVAKAFRNLGLDELYMADLNAILSKGCNLACLNRIKAKTKMKVMVDAGFRNIDEVKRYIEAGADKIVLATETLESLEKFEEMNRSISTYGLPTLASIDVKGKKVICGSRAFRMHFGKLIQIFEESGASEIIILSLDRVGTSLGPDWGLVQDALNHAHVPILVGGGIRNMDDVRELEKLGVEGVLLATALHKGVFTKDGIKNLLSYRTKK